MISPRMRRALLWVLVIGLLIATEVWILSVAIDRTVSRFPEVEPLVTPISISVIVAFAALELLAALQLLKPRLDAHRALFACLAIPLLVALMAVAFYVFQLVATAGHTPPAVYGLVFVMLASAVMISWTIVWVRRGGRRRALL